MTRRFGTRKSPVRHGERAVVESDQSATFHFLVLNLLVIIWFRPKVGPRSRVHSLLKNLLVGQGIKRGEVLRRADMPFTSFVFIRAYPRNPRFFFFIPEIDILCSGQRNERPAVAYAFSGRD
jgi:hypothetical protein